MVACLHQSPVFVAISTKLLVGHDRPPGLVDTSLNRRTRGRFPQCGPALLNYGEAGHSSNSMRQLPRPGSRTLRGWSWPERPQKARLPHLRGILRDVLKEPEIHGATALDSGLPSDPLGCFMTDCASSNLVLIQFLSPLSVLTKCNLLDGTPISFPG